MARAAELQYKKIFEVNPRIKGSFRHLDFPFIFSGMKQCGMTPSCTKNQSYLKIRAKNVIRKCLKDLFK